MKKAILLLCLLLVSCSSSNRLAEEVGYYRGSNRAMEICERNYESVIAQFIPEEGCINVVFSGRMMSILPICEGGEAVFIDCKGKCGAGYNMPPPKERLIAYRKDGELVLGVEDASNTEKEKEEENDIR